MKLFFFLFICLLNTIALAQRQELQFSYRFGFPTNSLQKVSPYTNSGNINQYQFENVQCLYDNGIILNHKFEIYKKFKLFLTSGLEFSQTSYYKPIIDGQKRLLENIEINSQRWAYHVGLSKQIHFYDSRIILDIGFQFVDRYSIKKQQSYSTDFHSTQDDWIKLKYNLNAYFGDYHQNDGTISNGKYIYLNSDINVHAKFKLNKNVYFNFGLNYIRNVFFFYDLNYSVQYYYGGSSTPNETYDYLGYGTSKSKFAVRDHFIYLNLGFSYKFN